jgi:hypothetical protein
MKADKSCTGKTIAIVQSSYIPWKGYFDLINMVDEFILLDDVQYTRRDWRNRNKIKTPKGLKWLTIPVDVKGKYLQLIKETRISDPSWPRSHWESIRQNYRNAAHFTTYADRLEALYLGCKHTYLSDINYRFLVALCKLLGIETPITWSMDYEVVMGKTERLLQLCVQAGASTYLSGPRAQSYLDETAFAAEGISVRYMNYDGYPEYDQLHGPFEHNVSVIDLLLNMGPAAPRYLTRSSRCAGQRRGV